MSPWLRTVLSNPGKTAITVGSKEESLILPYTPPILEEGEVINAVLLSLATQVSYGKSW